MSSAAGSPPAHRYAPVTFIFGVLAGTATAITAKILMGLQAVGADGEVAYFEKPLLITWVMFLSMALAMPLYWLKQGWDAWRSREDGLYEMQVEQLKQKRVTWRQMLALLVPTVLDLAATALCTAGLVYTTVSVSQLVRCSVLIFTALLKATVLRERLSKYMWYGLGINTIAMILIASISFVPGHMEVQPGIHRDPRIGIALILLGCIIQGTQYVWEEKLMTDKIPPLVIVGMEGVWGAVLMPLVVFPWAAVLPGSDYGGCIESVQDSSVMIGNSSAIKLFLSLFFLSVLLYNIFAIYVTYLLNSVWHAILENFRPGAVWIVDLAIFYVITAGEFGEAWTAWSWLELLGMGIMILGTAVYNGSVRVPGCEYDEDAGQRTKGEAGEENQFISKSSSSVTASPLIQRNVARQRRLSVGLGSIDNLYSLTTDDSSTSPDPSSESASSDGLSDYATKSTPPLTSSAASARPSNETTALLIASARSRRESLSGGSNSGYGSQDTQQQEEDDASAQADHTVYSERRVQSAIEKIQKTQQDEKAKQEAAAALAQQQKKRRSTELAFPPLDSSSSASSAGPNGNGSNNQAGKNANGKQNGKGRR